jgi:hypothetical protein
VNHSSSFTARARSDIDLVSRIPYLDVLDDWMEMKRLGNGHISDVTTLTGGKQNILL